MCVGVRVSVCILFHVHECVDEKLSMNVGRYTLSEVFKQITYTSIIQIRIEKIVKFLTISLDFKTKPEFKF